VVSNCEQFWEAEIDREHDETRVSVYAFKQVIICYSWGSRTTVTKFLAAANKCIKTSNVSSRAEA